MVRKAEGLFQDSDTYRDPSEFHIEKHFRELVRYERMRAKRSGRPCLLMLLDIAGLGGAWKNRYVRQIETTLSSVTRETDVKGWWLTGSVIGILFTEITAPTSEALIQTEKTIEAKVFAGLRKEMGSAVVERIALSL